MLDLFQILIGSCHLAIGEDSTSGIWVNRSESTELLLRNFNPIEDSLGDVIYTFSVKCGQMWIIFSINMKKFHRGGREEGERGGKWGRMLTFAPIAYPSNTL